MVQQLKPHRGGFLRAFRLGWFIREFLLGRGPYESAKIGPKVGSPQAEIFHEYKMALRRATALDRATRTEEKAARKQKRWIDPENIESLTEKYLDRMPYKATGCRYHSFVVYFSNLQRLGWVEFTGKEERSEFQDNYADAQPRKYFRLTISGKRAGDADWSDPRRTLYPEVPPPSVPRPPLPVPPKEESPSVETPKVSSPKPKVTGSEVSRKWHEAKRRNAALAGKDLDLLSPQFEASQAKEALADYSAVTRTGYADAEEYREARDEAWDAFLDALEDMAAEESEP